MSPLTEVGSTPSSRAAVQTLIWRLTPAAVIIAFVALSIHVVMLQVLRIPYPDLSGVGRLGLVLVALRTLALLIVCRLTQPALGRWPLVGRIAVIVLLDMAIAGHLRGAVMEAVVTTELAFPAIKLLVQLAESIVLATLVVASLTFVRRPVGLLAAALGLTAITMVLNVSLAQRIVQRFLSLRAPEVYVEPYGAYVLSWSYATFLETVAAVLAIAALIGPRLSSRPIPALLQFTGLILLLRGTLVMQLLFPWAMPAGFLPSSLSTGQFFLQDLALAVLAWWAWQNNAAASAETTRMP